MRRKKRKLVLEDSDDDMGDVDASAFNKGLSAYEPSPDTKKTGRLLYDTLIEVC